MSRLSRLIHQLALVNGEYLSQHQPLPIGGNAPYVCRCLFNNRKEVIQCLIVFIRGRRVR
jgi:hypothetical protein